MAVPHGLTPASYLVLFRDGQTLLLRRANTGYADGQLSLIAGHVDPGESFTQCVIREAREEAGITLRPEDLRVAHVMQRRDDLRGDERIDVFFVADRWEGEILNCEPHKCSELCWESLEALPDDILSYVRDALLRIANKERFSEWGTYRDRSDPEALRPRHLSR